MTDNQPPTEGCEACEGGTRSAQHKRLVVPAIGKAMPPQEPEDPASQLQAMVMDPQMAQANANLPALVIHMHNMLQRVQVEHLALKQVLTDRGLVTDRELMRAVAHQSRLLQQGIQEIQSGLRGGPPTQARPSTDPRSRT